MAKKNTVFQALDRAITGNWGSNDMVTPHINSYDLSGGKGDDILFRTTDKEEYLNKKLELQQNKYLKDRWIKANVNLSVTAYAGLNNVKLMYRDADMMDAFPEIGAALDIVSEEACLYGDTRIKLLNGETKTIRELYNGDYKDFWVYAVDEHGNCKPSHVDKVLFKGKKELYLITLDDGTEIKCTGDHKWMLSDGTWAETKDLSFGDSLMSIYEKTDYKGYEKIKSTREDSFKHTHRVVAECELHDEKLKLVEENRPYQRIVIHHKSFNKQNNDPRELCYMFWDEHQKLHSDLNSERWNDPEYSEKMRRIFSETGKKTWMSEKREEMIKKMSESQKKRVAKFSDEERVAYFARNGEKNGMYGVHRFGSDNPNFDTTKNHVGDIDEDKYIKCLVEDRLSRKEMYEFFNIGYKTYVTMNKHLCDKYGIKTIKELVYKVLNDKFLSLVEEARNSKKKISFDEFASMFGQTAFITRKFFNKNGLTLSYINENKNTEYNLYEICDYLDTTNVFNYSLAISDNFNVSRKKSQKITKDICEKYKIGSIRELRYYHNADKKIKDVKDFILENPNSKKEDVAKSICFTPHELLVFAKTRGYSGYNDLKKSVCNHRVISVQNLGVVGDVYDLANSSVNACYGVRCNNGQIISHNCITNADGNIVNVYSKSERIKSILEDLFVNRLNIQLTGQMVIRAMCKYGNQFMLLDIDNKNGVKGWKQLPVFNVERIENGIQNPYGGASVSINGINKNEADLSTQFIWLDDNNSQTPFRDWQVAHFRLLANSLYLPYGVSFLNSARRHWRMLSLMEDMMLIYRLERSIERRVYKIYVGAIDDADVQAYVEEVANQFKRTPIIDPMTGQVDLRKNLLDVSQDIFVPVRDENAPTPIDTLSAAQNMTALDDIKFVQNKVFTALRIPKTFLNFEENAGDGKNLALLDIRFTRTINRVQQAFLMELTKIATIHLFLLGFGDELTNFTLSMNNPSTQAEGLEIENMQKKIDAVRDAVSDPGNGLPVMSQTRALKEIMKWSEKEIKENFEEIRLEKGIAAELEKTTQIIKKTGIFDKVDRLYGEPGAEYMDDQQQQGGDEMGGGDMGGAPPMGGGGADLGGELDALGEPGGDESGDIGGTEGSMPTADMGSGGDVGMGDQGGEQPMESKSRKKPLIVETAFERYLNKLSGHKVPEKETKFERAKIYDSESLLINEEFDKMIGALSKFVDNDEE